MIKTFIRRVLYLVLPACLLGAIVIVGVRLYIYLHTERILSFVSNHITHNMKAEFVLQHKARYDSARIILIGSSMCVNNISGVRIEDSLSLCTINLGAWSLKLSDFETYDIWYRKTKGIIVLNLQFTDFYPSGFIKKRGYPYSRRFSEEFLNVLFDFDSYLSQNYEAHDYINDLSKTGYNRMSMDRTGSAIFQQEGFRIARKRWIQAPGKPSPKDFVAFFNTLQNLHAQSSRPIIIAFSPCRKKFQDSSYQHRLSYVSHYFKTHLSHIPFFNNGLLKLPDTNFVDATHLSHTGALRYTDTLIKQIRPYLKDIPRGKSCQ